MRIYFSKVVNTVFVEDTVVVEDIRPFTVFFPSLDVIVYGVPIAMEQKWALSFS